MEDDSSIGTARTAPAPEWAGLLKGDVSAGQTIRPDVDPLGATAMHPTDLPPRAADPLATNLDLLPDARAATLPSAPSSGRTDPPRAPTTAFDILRVLGRGGMGVVYAARQSSLRREIAVKMMVPERQSPVDQARFTSEALATGDLDHPNIVPIHDFGRDASGQLFMAMKLVKGTSWDKLLKAESDGKALRDHLEILIKVCDGVAFAHARNVVHRDLKPENVMVGEFGEVLVMDWGIAVDVGVAPATPRDRKAESRATTSACAGTIAYMAPEVARGERELIGPTTDVYLLGGILYEILTGTPPHVAATVTEALEAAAHGKVPPPEVRAPERRTPRELSRIVMKALSADPAGRHANAVGFRDEVRAFLAHEESLKLVEDARQKIERLRAPGVVPRAERYAAHAEALRDLAQAIRLWPENVDALAVQARALADVADEAIDRGDLGLAATYVAELARHPNRERVRLAPLEAAVASRSSSRVRALLLAAGLVLAVVFGYRATRGWSDEVARPRMMRDAGRAAAVPIWRGWLSARNGDAPGIDRALAELAGKQGRPWRARDAEDGLHWAREVVLWREGRWAELADALDASRSRAVERADLAAKLRARPELKGTSLAERLADLRGPRPNDGATSNGQPQGEPPARSVWSIVTEETRRGGLPPNALAAVLDELSRGAAAPEVSEEIAPTFPDLARQRAALRVAALWALAHEAAMRSPADEGLRATTAAHLVPCSFSAPPFGMALTPATLPPIIVPDGSGSKWIALDPATRAERWRFAMPDARAVVSAVPVDDGSVVFAGRGELLRLDGRDGRVIARAYTDGDPLSLWPDPLDRTRAIVAVATDPNEGYLHEVRFRAGMPESLVVQPDFVTELAPGRRASALKDRLLAEGRGMPGPSASTDHLIGGLREAATREPLTPRLWDMLLEAGGTKLPSDERQRIAQTLVSFEDLPPMAAAQIGTRLELAGFRPEANRLYDRAAETFLARGGNAALAPVFLGNPAAILRRHGDQVFASDPERALELVEQSRLFSEYIEGDHQFYRSYAEWLRARGRTSELPKISQRVEESRLAGGSFLLPADFLIALDISIMLVLFVPAIMVVLTGRTWWRARAARIADLHAAGFRTRVQRLTAFVTHPTQRIAHTSFVYASRWARLSLVVLATLSITSAAVAIERVKAIGRAAALPTYLMQGYAGQDGLLKRAEDDVKERGPSAQVARLLAEGYFARGDHARAARRTAEAAALAPNDAGTKNNAALLAERAGRADEARTGYESAARLGGEGAFVARWNLARLAKDEAGMTAAEATMAHRDRLAARRRLSPPAPLWARAAFTDLQMLVAPGATVRTDILVGVPQMLSTDFAELSGLFPLTTGETMKGATGGSVPMSAAMKGYGAIFVGLSALLLLPLPARPLPDRSGDSPGDGHGHGPAPKPGRLGAIRQRLRPWRKHVRFLAVPASLVPGAWELLAGSSAAGSAMLLLAGASGAIAYTIRTGGLLGQITTNTLFKGYFGGVARTAAYPDLFWVANLAIATLVALYVLAFALAIWRMRGPRNGLSNTK